MDIKSLPQDLRTYLRNGTNINSVAQCVTELVLNSLDAKSTAVAVRVNLQSFQIQVVDNGSGVTKSNMNSIGIRYMTSKCHSLTDLKKLKHFGFRGEALATITGISQKVTIMSRPQDIENTYRKTCVNKKWDTVKLVKHRPSQGTTVTVEGFMHNLPVRRKRINQNLDLNEIKRALENLAIIHPSVSFHLRNDVDGKIVMQSKQNQTVSQALANLYPDVSVNDLVEIKVSKRSISISGLICKKPHNIKLQLIYLNKRPVTSQKIQKFVDSLLLKVSIFHDANKKNYPVYVLNIRCPYSKVDLNLGPSKSSVEFKEWDNVLKCIEKTIRLFLEKENLTPQNPMEAANKGAFVPSFRSKFGTSQIQGAVISVPFKRKHKEEVINLPKKLLKIDTDIDNDNIIITTGSKSNQNDNYNKDEFNLNISATTDQQKIELEDSNVSCFNLKALDINKQKKAIDSRIDCDQDKVNKQRNLKTSHGYPKLPTKFQNKQIKQGKNTAKAVKNATKYKRAKNSEKCKGESKKTNVLNDTEGWLDKILPFTKRGKRKHSKNIACVETPDIHNSKEINVEIRRTNFIKNNHRQSREGCDFNSVEDTYNIIKNPAHETTANDEATGTNDDYDDLLGPTAGKAVNHYKAIKKSAVPNQQSEDNNKKLTSVFDKHANTQSMVLNSELDTAPGDLNPLFNSTINTNIVNNQSAGKDLIMDMFLRSTAIFPPEESGIGSKTVKTIIEKNTRAKYKNANTTMTLSLKVLSKRTVTTNTMYVPHNWKNRDLYNRSSDDATNQQTSTAKMRQFRPLLECDKSMVSKCIQTTMIEREKTLNVNLHVEDKHTNGCSEMNITSLLHQNEKYNVTFSKYFKKPHERKQFQCETPFIFNEKPTEFIYDSYRNRPIAYENNQNFQESVMDLYTNYRNLNPVNLNSDYETMPRFANHRRLSALAPCDDIAHFEQMLYPPIDNNDDYASNLPQHEFLDFSPFHKPTHRYVSDYNYGFSNSNRFDQSYGHFMGRNNLQDINENFSFLNQPISNHWQNNHYDNLSMNDPTWNLNVRPRDSTIPIYQSCNSQRFEFGECFKEPYVNPVNRNFTRDTFYNAINHNETPLTSKYFPKHNFDKFAFNNNDRNRYKSNFLQEAWDSNDYCRNNFKNYKYQEPSNAFNVGTKYLQRLDNNIFGNKFVDQNHCIPQHHEKEPGNVRQRNFFVEHQQPMHVFNQFEKPLLENRREKSRYTNEIHTNRFKLPQYREGKTAKIRNQNFFTGVSQTPMQLTNHFENPVRKKETKIFLQPNQIHESRFINKNSGLPQYRQQKETVNFLTEQHPSPQYVPKFKNIRGNEKLNQVQALKTRRSKGCGSRKMQNIFEDERHKQPNFFPTNQNCNWLQQNCKNAVMTQNRNYFKPLDRQRRSETHKNLNFLQEAVLQQGRHQQASNDFMKRHQLPLLNQEVQINTPSSYTNEWKGPKPPFKTFYSDPLQQGTQPAFYNKQEKFRQIKSLSPYKKSFFDVCNLNKGTFSSPSHSPAEKPTEIDSVCNKQKFPSPSLLSIEEEFSNFYKTNKFVSPVIKPCTEFPNGSNFNRKQKLPTPMHININFPQFNQEHVKPANFKDSEYSFATPNMNLSASLNTIEKIDRENANEMTLDTSIHSGNFKPLLSSTRFEIIEESSEQSDKLSKNYTEVEGHNSSPSVINETPSNFVLQNLNLKPDTTNNDLNHLRNPANVNLNQHHITTKRKFLNENNSDKSCDFLEGGRANSISEDDEEDQLDTETNAITSNEHKKFNCDINAANTHNKIYDDQNEWIQATNTFGSTFYIHKRTGMTSFCSPRQDNHFALGKRLEFVPKGLSPIFVETEKVDVSLSPTSKRNLNAAILESYENELNTVKWAKYINDPQDINKFFEELYQEKTKQHDCCIPNATTSELPRVMVKLYRNLQNHSFTKDILANLEVIGQWDNKFIITVLRGKQLLVVFDQHAVHERIRLEKLLDDYKDNSNQDRVRFKSTECQQKIIVDLHETDVSILNNYKNLFEDLGLLYQNSQNAIEITHIPTCIYNKFKKKPNDINLKNIITSLIAEHINIIIITRGIPSKIPAILQNVINSEACRGAIKFGDPLSYSECVAQIIELSKCKVPFQCAHGRPTLVPLVSLDQNYEMIKLKPSWRKLINL